MAYPRSGNAVDHRGISLIELLFVIGILVVLVVIASTAITGSGNSPGVREKANRTVNAINMNQVYMGFFTWGESHNQQYPSTKILPTMESDTTHQVFSVLLEDGHIAGQQLQSPNEIETGYTIGYAGSFGPENTSFALNDYDADNWQRHQHWNNYRNGSYVLLSDRWVEIPGYEYNTINETFWFVMFNDGHTENVQTSALRNGDDLFEANSQFGAEDALMAHD